MLAYIGIKDRLFINAAAHMFQNIIQRILLNMPGVINMSNAILIFGPSEIENNEVLETVLEG